MTQYKLTQQQAEICLCDGFGKTKSPDGASIMKVFISVRRDREIPQFDAISDFKYWCEGFEEFEKYTLKLAEILTEYNGMFIEDALKLEEKDLFSLMGENINPDERFVIPALRATKKAIIDYFNKTGQENRACKASEKVICNCRHVTDLEIKEAVEKGKSTFEEVSKYTGAGTGCNTCINKTKELVEQYRKTAIGEIK